jgi:hypothetical protein
MRCYILMTGKLPAFPGYWENIYSIICINETTGKFMDHPEVRAAIILNSPKNDFIMIKIKVLQKSSTF